MMILVTFTSIQGLCRAEILGTAGQPNSGEIASVTGDLQTQTTCMDVEYNNYGFASSASALDEKIQLHSEKN